MARLTCPSCGAALPFRSSISIYTVCASCGSMVVRTDGALETLGQMAMLPEEVSPLHVGAGLTWQGKTYTVLGRARIGWADGFWNEWFIDGGHGPGWLEEAQGFLSISFEQSVPPALSGDLPALGDVAAVDGQVFTVSDIKRAVCLGSEGELPFRAPKGRTATYVDMISQDGAFAGLEDAADGRQLFVGHYAPFDAFHFTGLRRVDGWSSPRRNDDRTGDPRYAGGPATV